MNKYETVFYIASDGTDLYDAGEKAGRVIKGSSMGRHTVISCSETRAFLVQEGQGVFGRQRARSKYRTEIRVVDLARNYYEAMEKAEDLLDLREMDRGIVISLDCNQLAEGEIKSPQITEELEPVTA
jgi:hypothetical protein